MQLKMLTPVTVLERGHGCPSYASAHATWRHLPPAIHPLTFGGPALRLNRASCQQFMVTHLPLAIMCGCRV